MYKKGLPDRRLIRVRRRKKVPVILYVTAALIAILFLIVLIALAFNQDDDKLVSSADLTTLSASSTETTETTTTTTDSTATSYSTAATSNATIESAAVPVSDEYFDDACFIGDSRTQGLMMYSSPEKATFYAIRGMNVASFFNDKAFEKKTMTAEKMLQKKKFGKIYIMLGLNELGWTQVDSFIKRYGELVDSVKKSQPDAKIFIQSILPVSAAKSKSHPSFNNPRILKYNRLIYDMCVQKKVIYLNVRKSVEDKKGNLPAEATTDGIHMNKTYCDKWMDYLRMHTEVPVATPTTKKTTETSSTETTTITEPSTTQTTQATSTTISGTFKGIAV